VTQRCESVGGGRGKLPGPSVSLQGVSSSIGAALSGKEEDIEVEFADQVAKQTEAISKGTGMVAFAASQAI
jgi:hypothetical protein